MQVDIWKNDTLLKEYQFHDGEFKAGRQPDSDIVLNGKKISRHHFSFTISKNFVVVKDSGSINGLYYKNKKVTQKKIKGSGSIQVGEYTIRFSSKKERNEQQKREQKKVKKNNNEKMYFFHFPWAIPFVVIFCSGFLLFTLQSLTNSRNQEILSEKSTTELGFLIVQTLNELNRSNWVENRIDQLTLNPFDDNEFVLSASLVDYDGVILLPHKDAGIRNSDESILESLKKGIKKHIVTDERNRFIAPLLHNGISIGAAVITLSNPEKTIAKKYQLVMVVFLLTVIVMAAVIGSCIVVYMYKKSLLKILDQIPSYLKKEIDIVEIPEFYDKNNSIRKAIELIYHCASLKKIMSDQVDSRQDTPPTAQSKQFLEQSVSSSKKQLEGEMFCTVNTETMDIECISPEFSSFFDISSSTPSHILQLIADKEQVFVDLITNLLNDNKARIPFTYNTIRGIGYTVAKNNESIHIIIKARV